MRPTNSLPPALLLTAALLAGLPARSRAQWATGGTLVSDSSATVAASFPHLASDGHGGAFLLWSEERFDANAGLYLQHVLADGRLDDNWPKRGVAIPQSPRPPFFHVTADGFGGAYLAWTRSITSGWNEIRAHHVLGSSALDSRWPADGLVIEGSLRDHQLTSIAAAGDSGLVLFWNEPRTDEADVFGQRVRPNGTIAWSPGGKALAPAVSGQYFPLCAPGEGGSWWVLWEDTRSPSLDTDLYALRLGLDGTPIAGFPSGGALVTGGTGEQSLASIAADGTGGLLATWVDERNVGTDLHGPDIYAQRLAADGSPRWGAFGLPVCDADGFQYQPLVVRSDSGDPMVIWYDERSAGTWRAYVQRLEGDGSRSAGWPANGRPALSFGDFREFGHELLPDGLDGAYVITGFGGDIVAQHLDATGALLWGASGKLVCGAPNFQLNHAAMASEAGGAIAVWQDDRVPRNPGQLYATRLAPGGPFGTVDAPLGAPASVALRLARNPVTRGAIDVEYALPGGDPATLELLDVQGRRLERLDLPGGPRRGVASLRRPAMPGVYWVRLGGVALTLTRRVAVLP